MSIKQLQNSLGVVVDGVWGQLSQKKLDDSQKFLNLSFDKVRASYGSLTPSQVAGFNRILRAANEYKPARNPLILAYILATAWHETATKMQPVEEYGRGKGRRYGEWLTNSKGVKYCYANGDLKKPKFYTQQEYSHLYYGRGDSQLTWLDNYIELGKLIGVDLANNPHLALEPVNSAKILFAGTIHGKFTGKKLADYIRLGAFSEYREARRTVNGTDKAEVIANHALKFLDAIILTYEAP